MRELRSQRQRGRGCSHGGPSRLLLPQVLRLQQPDTRGAALGQGARRGLGGSLGGPFASLLRRAGRHLEPVPAGLRAGTKRSRDVVFPPCRGRGARTGRWNGSLRRDSWPSASARLRRTTTSRPPTSTAYRAERRDGLATGGYDLEIVRVPGDSQSRPFMSAVCVAVLAMHPLEAPELISNVDQRGPQAVLEHIAHPDAENLSDNLERFGFTMNIRGAPSGRDRP